jgi:Methylamine utilisation protein MauE
MELIGLCLVASGLLVFAGAAKAVRPEDTARALAALAPGCGGPARERRVRRAVRVGALGEAVIGLVALALPRPTTAAVVALSYATFAGVVLLARWRGGPLATCGCFGRPDTPPTLVHLVLDLVLAAAATTVAVGAPEHGSILSQLAGQPWAGVPLVFACATGMWLTFLALSTLSALEGNRRLAHPARA